MSAIPEQDKDISVSASIPPMADTLPKDWFSEPMNKSQKRRLAKKRLRQTFDKERFKREVGKYIKTCVERTKNIDYEEVTNIINSVTTSVNETVAVIKLKSEIEAENCETETESDVDEESCSCQDCVEPPQKSTKQNDKVPEPFFMGDNPQGVSAIQLEEKQPKFVPFISSEPIDESLKKFTCNQCGQHHKDSIELNDHILIVHEEAFYEEPPAYNCRSCNQGFARLGDYYTHMDTTHQKSKKVKKSDVPVPLVLIKPKSVEVASDNKKLLDEFLDNKFKVFDLKYDIKCELPTKHEPTQLPEVVTPGIVINDEKTDRVPTSLRGRYICKSCGKKYATPQYLGEHYTFSHSEYTEQLLLDKKEIGGFPGLDMLKHINMFSYLAKSDEYDIIRKETCLICVDPYLELVDIFKSNEHDIKSVIKNKKINDDIITIYNKPKLIVKYTCDMELMVPSFRRKNPQGVPYNDKSRDVDKPIKKRPLTLTCCGKLICDMCLENTVKYTNTLICPFCKHDHTQYSQDYVKCYEPEEYNECTWQKWWSNKLDILYPHLNCGDVCTCKN